MRVIRLQSYVIDTLLSSLNLYRTSSHDPPILGALGLEIITTAPNQYCWCWVFHSQWMVNKRQHPVSQLGGWVDRL